MMIIPLLPLARITAPCAWKASQLVTEGVTHGYEHTASTPHTAPGRRTSPRLSSNPSDVTTQASGIRPQASGGMHKGIAQIREDRMSVATWGPAMPWLRECTPKWRAIFVCSGAGIGYHGPAFDRMQSP